LEKVEKDDLCSLVLYSYRFATALGRLVWHCVLSWQVPGCDSYEPLGIVFAKAGSGCDSYEPSTVCEWMVLFFDDRSSHWDVIWRIQSAGEERASSGLCRSDELN